MGSRGHCNLKRKRTRKEPTTASASSEGVNHADDLTKRNSKKHQSPATKPTAQEEEAHQPAGAGKTKTKEKRKRMRVVTERLPEKLIQIMIVHPHYVCEISDESLAWRSEESRASYAQRKARSEKMQADDQALIDQYLIDGYAESVREVTDDEDDGGGVDMEEEIVDIIN